MSLFALSSDNITILQKYFNPLYFNVYQPYAGNIIVSSLENPNNHCLELNIHGSHMKVEYISKCNYRISGSQILGIIQKFVKENGGINIVELQDTSKLPNLCKRYDIPLYIIYILSTGKSWYNSYGYKSANYDNEIRHNKKLLHMTMFDFMIACNTKSYHPMDETELLEMIDIFYNVMNDHQYYKNNKQRTKLHSQMSVKETFTRLKNYVLKNMPEIREVGFETNEYCYALKWLMDLVHNSDIILYDSARLVWTVPRSFSGRKSSHRIASSIRKRHSTKYNKTRVSRSNTLKRRSI
jgi:hypothetical protein